MGLIMISFIGKGQTPRSQAGISLSSTSRGGYIKTCYAFDTEAVESSLFGAALKDVLLQRGQAPARWLVMGTSLSAWTELLEAIPEAAQDQLFELHDRVYAAIKDRSIDESLLAEWQNALNAHSPKTEILCRLVGEMGTLESQHNTWNALNEVVEKQDRIVMDITNSLRHQPVIASFMLMALRWLKDVTEIQFYYGAFELSEPGDSRCPVLRLDIIPALVQASEAISTFRHTGSILPMTTFLPLNEPYARQANQVALAEETNQVTSRVQQEALQLHNSLKRMALPSPIDTALLPLLSETLEWVGDENLGQQLLRKARGAHSTRQYAAAFASLWEAFCVTGCLCYGCGDPLTHKARKEGGEKLLDHLQATDSEAYKRFDTLRQTRNAIVHGTPASRDAIQDTLYHMDALDSLFENAALRTQILLQEYSRLHTKGQTP